MTTLEPSHTILTPQEVARILKVSLPLVYRMAQRGQLPCIRWEAPGYGKLHPRTTVRFDAHELREWIDSHRETQKEDFRGKLRA